MTISDLTDDGTQIADALSAVLADEPELVHRTLAALGRLLGAPVTRRPRDRASFVAHYLAESASGTATVSAALPGLLWPLVRVAVARLLETTSEAVLRDDWGVHPPSYELVDVGVDEVVAAPDDLAAFLPAGQAFDFDTVLVLSQRERATIEFYVRRPDTERARSELASLLRRARGADNFYRGRTVRATYDPSGLGLVPVRPTPVSRDEVIHTADVWREVDANIGGLLRHRETLAAAGLGAARGLLLTGPPGVGKTALCRAIAAELPAGTTVVLVDPGVGPQVIAALYESIADLAPAAIFLDDIDLFAGNRRTGAGPALGDFLVGLDGFRPPAPVITVATTNVTESLDAALLRPGRFDAIVEIGPPDEAARASILRRFLDPVAELDVMPVVAVTAGRSGAELREIVRRTVIERGADLTATHLVEVATSGRWRRLPSTGQYL